MWPHHREIASSNSHDAPASGVQGNNPSHVGKYAFLSLFSIRLANCSSSIQNKAVMYSSKCIDREESDSKWKMAMTKLGENCFQIPGLLDSHCLPLAYDLDLIWLCCKFLWIKGCLTIKCKLFYLAHEQKSHGISLVSYLNMALDLRNHRGIQNQSSYISVIPAIIFVVQVSFSIRGRNAASIYSIIWEMVSLNPNDAIAVLCKKANWPMLWTHACRSVEESPFLQVCYVSWTSVWK